MTTPEPPPRRLGCSVFTLAALLAGLADIVVLAVLLAALAAPRAAPLSPDTSPDQGVVRSAAGQLGAPQQQPAAAAVEVVGGALSAAAPPEPTAAGLRSQPSGSVEQTAERTAISAGVASWFPAQGDQGAVPWWRPGQDRVLAVVNAYHDGRAFSVTIWVTGFCACLVGAAGERLIDLSLGAFAQLADPAQGLVAVQLEIPTQGAVTGGKP